MSRPKTTASGPIYSIVIPALEEGSLIISSLQRISDFLRQSKMLETTEVIVVAAAGRDNTAQLAASQRSLFKHFQLIEPGAPAGKGRDVKVGMLAAKGQFVLFTDADLATPIEHCEQAFALLKNGRADMVIGVRNLWLAHKNLKRKVISVGSNWMVRILGGMPLIPDSQCGFKAFNKTAARTIFTRLTIQGWGFDIELLTIAKIHKLKIKKLAIADWHDPKLGTGLVAGESTTAAVAKTLGELLSIWRLRLKGAYQ